MRLMDVVVRVLEMERIYIYIGFGITKRES